MKPFPEGEPKVSVAWLRNFKMILLDARHPAPPGMYKTLKKVSDKLLATWCRISSINSRNLLPPNVQQQKGETETIQKPQRLVKELEMVLYPHLPVPFKFGTGS